jgi:L,D-transpeptidase catalytic domain
MTSWRIHLVRRTVGLLVCTISSFVLVAGVALAATPTPTASAAPAAPTTLTMSALGTKTSVAAGSWIKDTALLTHFQVASAGLIPQVEVERSTVAFTGTANYSASAVTAPGIATVRVDGLQNGKTYHWQARVVDGTGATSSWAALNGAANTDIGVDQTAPQRPVIRSPTNPNQYRWYNTRIPSFSWTAQDIGSGIQGYSYVLERQARVIPPGQITPQTTLQLRGLTDGSWFLALRAVDRAGNWSPTATYQLHLDRLSPRLFWQSPSKFTLNPYKGNATVRFAVNKDARVRLTLYRVGIKAPITSYSFPAVRGGRVVTLNWSGKTAKGQPVAKGYYFFAADVVDRADNTGHWNVGGITVDPQQPRRSVTGQILFPGDGKKIIVSLSRETLYAYDGDHLALQTVVTTGNPALPTPTGTTTVMAKYHPFEFNSPWPAGSQYWYPPSLAQYAMLFRDGGYFLHDAPWRSAFGPGTDGAGQPGTNYGGTHGCVNIPPGAMLFLWNWTPAGTTVMVVP